MSKHAPKPSEITLPFDARVAIVAARFNDHVVSKLLTGCVDRLTELGLTDDRVAIHRVPGAFELPVAAKMLADSRQFAAIICLGCVIRGETAHFEYVAGEAARGIQQVAIETGVPVIFGVLTVETEEQAFARTDGTHSHAGRDSASAAAEMIALANAVRSSS